MPRRSQCVNATTLSALVFLLFSTRAGFLDRASYESCIFKVCKVQDRAGHAACSVAEVESRKGGGTSALCQFEARFCSVYMKMNCCDEGIAGS